MADTTPQKILIIRNDKLGDFMLSLPVFKLLKAAIPNGQLHALVPDYTRDIALACDAIDQVIIDPGQQATFSQQRQLLRQIRRQKYTAVLTLFSTTRIGCLTWLSGIPYRLAPATKLAQIFYNHRLRQRRSQSEKPEYRYNLELAYRFLCDHHISTAIEASAPYLHFDPDVVTEQKQAFCRQHDIDATHKLIVVHPGSGGSASNLSLEQYAELVRRLELTADYHVVITAGPGEDAQAEQLSRLMVDVPHSIYISHQGLVNFARFLQGATLFISGSTGPLHIAGALDVPTAGFYPRRRSATSLRWQTLNSEAKRLGFMPPESHAEQDMQAIDLQQAAEAIRHQLLR